jgi:predicted RNase H-like nuclease
MPHIAGIDGCQSRWLSIAKEIGVDSGALEARVLDTSELALQPWTVVAIDIPIGIPDQGARTADKEARRLIGPRRNSVFPCPIRPALDARTWSEACAITQAADGRRITQQTFAILPKIRQVDAAIRTTNLKDRLFEIHPEVSFTAWQDAPMAYPKRKQEGNEVRLALVSAHFGADAYESVAAQVRGQGVAPDDILDAFAALWSAQRIFEGKAQRLPTEPVFDSLGIPMHIWY